MSHIIMAGCYVRFTGCTVRGMKKKLNKKICGSMHSEFHLQSINILCITITIY